MKREDENPEEVQLIVTNLEETPETDDSLDNEEIVGDEDVVPLSDDTPDDIPVAETVEDGSGRKRATWKIFASEDLPQLSLREVLGGDYLLGSFLRRNIMFILLLVFLGILYISNRYAAQQEIIEEEQLRKELVERKNYALTQYAELTMRSRQSSIERRLKVFGDSLLTSPKDPPFIIRVKGDEESGFDELKIEN